VPGWSSITIRAASAIWRSARLPVATSARRPWLDNGVGQPLSRSFCLSTWVEGNRPTRVPERACACCSGRSAASRGDGPPTTRSRQLSAALRTRWPSSEIVTRTASHGTVGSPKEALAIPYDGRYMLTLEGQRSSRKKQAVKRKKRNTPCRRSAHHEGHQSRQLRGAGARGSDTGDPVTGDRPSAKFSFRMPCDRVKQPPTGHRNRGCPSVLRPRVRIATPEVR